MSKVLQTAIVGYGKSAKHFHVPLLRAADGFSVRSVLQRSKNDAQLDFPDALIMRSMKDLLKDDKADLVIITSPNRFHFEQAFDALSADKHVVVEKPFCLTQDEGERLVRLARSKKRILSVFQNRRWDGDFLTVKKILHSKNLGRITEFESTFNRFRNRFKENAWKEKAEPGSGVFYDLSPHLIDQALILFGEPEKIYADIRSQRGGEADDYFDLQLYYPDKKVTLKAGMLVPEPTPRFIIRGTRGSFVKYGLDPQEQRMADGELPGKAGWGEDQEHQWGTLYLADQHQNITSEKVKTEPGSYPVFYQQLYQAICQKAEPPVFAETALKAIKIIECAIESSRSGSVIRYTGERSD